MVTSGQAQVSKELLLLGVVQRSGTLQSVFEQAVREQRVVLVRTLAKFAPDQAHVFLEHCLREQGCGPMVRALLAGGGSFLRIPTNIHKLLEDIFCERGKCDEVDLLLQNGASFRHVPCGVHALLEDFFKRYGKCQSVLFLESHGASFDKTPTDIHQLLWDRFREEGAGRNVQLLLERGASLIDVPQGLNALFEGTLRDMIHGKMKARSLRLLLDHGASPERAKLGPLIRDELSRLSRDEQTRIAKDIFSLNHCDISTTFVQNCELALITELIKESELLKFNLRIVPGSEKYSSLSHMSLPPAVFDRLCEGLMWDDMFPTGWHSPSAATTTLPDEVPTVDDVIPLFEGRMSFAMEQRAVLEAARAQEREVYRLVAYYVSRHPVRMNWSAYCPHDADSVEGKEQKLQLLLSAVSIACKIRLRSLRRDLQELIASHQDHFFVPRFKSMLETQLPQHGLELLSPLVQRWVAKTVSQDKGGPQNLNERYRHSQEDEDSETDEENTDDESINEASTDMEGTADDTDEDGTGEESN